MNPELTILMPCLNEAETIGLCIDKANDFLTRSNMQGEVLVADNGSSDGSQSIAEGKGAKVITAGQKGYGSALISGIRAAKGKYIIMGDSDDSYDFSKLENFVVKLREGNDLVMGNRFKGGIMPNAMPWLHRYIGNPVLSFIGRLFFNIRINDFHCGLRGFDREKILALDLRTPGMEFASEMVVKASLFNYRIAEVPTVLHPDGRTRSPHLRTWNDGWRHLRFLLLFSPKWLFLIPGILMFLLSTLLFIIITVNPIVLTKVRLDIHTLTVCGFGIILSYQLIIFAILSKTYAVYQGLIPGDRLSARIESIFSLERVIITGLLLLVAGIVMISDMFIYWSRQSFGNINDLSYTFRILIPAAVFATLGFQTLFTGFMMSTLQIVDLRLKKI